MSFKNVIAFGCSWTHGYGLDDPESESYPALIAKQYDIPCINLAEPGASLISMTWTLNNYLNENDIDGSLVLVGLTFDSRYSWFNAGYEVYTDPDGPTFTEYKYVDSTMVQDRNEHWKEMHKLHYTLSDCPESNRLLYETTVRHFDALQAKHNCKVLQLNIDHLPHKPVRNVVSPFEATIHLSNNYLGCFQEDKHPNAKGHRIIAAEIIKLLDLHV